MTSSLALATWLRGKRKTAPIGYLLVTCGGPDNPLDRVDPEAGENDEDLARRVLEIAQADADAYRSADRGDPYFVYLFRPGAPRSHEARRALEIDTERRGAPVDETNALAVTTRGLIDQGRIMATLSKQGIEKQDTAAQRRDERFDRLETRMYDLMDRYLTSNLAQEELAERREDRKQREKLYDALLHQAEIFIPLAVSEFVARGEHERGKPPPPLQGPNASAEARLLAEFLAMLTPEEIDRIQGLMSPMQRMAIGQILAGKVIAPLIPATVQRVMEAMTVDQVRAVLDALEAPEKRDKFMTLHMVRKLGLAFRPEPESPRLNGAAS
jgi:hypothetical protein